ncbi:MAG: acetate kinase, partial [Oscillospiraceae bacterium]
MKVLVLNCGSSSLKYQLIDMENEAVLCIGLVERIGIEGSILKQEKDGVEGKYIVEQPMKNHEEAIKLVLDAVVDPTYGGVKDIKEVEAVGHRVVHAGEKFATSVVITDEVEAALKECIELAPLHNPANIMGIDACKSILPGVPMVGVFDTA